MNWLLFLSVLAQIETGGDGSLVGDLSTRYPAYTVYQIRQPYLDDSNRFAGTNHTMEQLRADQKLAGEMVITYICRYGKTYTKKTGKPLSMEAAFRMHNGGPLGWKKSVTLKYWDKAKKEMKRRNAG